MPLPGILRKRQVERAVLDWVRRIVKANRASVFAAGASTERHDPASLSEVGDQLDRRRVGGLRQHKVQRVVDSGPMLVDFPPERLKADRQLLHLGGQIT